MTVPGSIAVYFCVFTEIGKKSPYMVKNYPLVAENIPYTPAHGKPLII